MQPESPSKGARFFNAGLALVMAFGLGVTAATVTEKNDVLAVTGILLVFGISTYFTCWALYMMWRTNRVLTAKGEQ